MKAKMLSPSDYTMSRKTLGRLLFGFGSDYNQVYSMEMLNRDFDIHLDKELEAFQYQVFSQFKKLSDYPNDEILSLDWLCALLEAFVACHHDFEDFTSKHKADFAKPPLDKLLKEFFDRISIKGLDICNAVCDGIDKIRCSNKYLEIVLDALNFRDKRRPMSKGQFRRAKKALTGLSNVMTDNSKEYSGWFLSRSRRLKSFGRHSSKVKDLKRSVSWSVSNSWSASKQLQSMSHNMILPGPYEITTNRGLANVVFTMSFVTMFVMWALVAAIPCQGRGILTNLSVPNNFLWASPLSIIQVRIINESKKHDCKNSFGLLKENYQMEKSVRVITNLDESGHQFPLTEEEKEKVKLAVGELQMVNNAYEKWLFPFECQVRQVFHKIMSCRLEGLQNLCRTCS
uniref:protein ROH1-like n=1 Tax=Erigeron canadensis TaxID=72917 RepID=UPI001CB985AC|nr:protein ROH1-like [Erigeron canadensis]